MPIEKKKVGTKPLTPYGGAEPVFVDVQVKPDEAELLKDYGDLHFRDLPMSDFEAYRKRDPQLCRVSEYQGYVCFRRQPFLHWHVHCALDGSELPLTLQGSFTTDYALKKAIDALKG